MLRWDVLPYIPDDAKRILSLGCGAALTEGKYRHTHDCHITGIEISADAAKKAENHIDKVITGHIIKVFSQFEGQQFDCILALDILEHLPDPWFTLRQYTSLLTPNGVVIASIPNINHDSIRISLNLDIFPYVSVGVLDFTHLRFFTLTEIYKLFAQAGLKVTRLNPFKTRTKSIQYIVTGRPIHPPQEQIKATIVIPVLNNLRYTQQCIESLKRNTHVPYSVIVVDNGSTDGTRKWLEEQKDILHVFNVSNLGFGVAVNQGLLNAQTPYTVIANNDILFTPNWLSHLIAHAEKDKQIGLVGPRSNYVSGPQEIKASMSMKSYDLGVYGQNRYEASKGASREFHRLVFFCVLIKTSVLNRIGLLDERFIIGNFEDDDFCLRATQAGYKLLIADDVFIYHYGSTTFKSAGVDYNKIIDINRQLFKKKWGKVIR